MARYGRQGLRAQQLFRLLLAVLASGVALSVPAPERDVCLAIAAAHLLWGAATVALTRHPGSGWVRWAWTGLLVDLLAIAATTAAVRATAPGSAVVAVLASVLFVVPALAAVQLQPVACATVGVLTTLTYLTLPLSIPRTSDSGVTLLASTAVLAGLALTCVLLCRLQRSRVLTLFHLAAESTRRAEDEPDIELRERRMVADHLRARARQPLIEAQHDLEQGQDSDAVVRQRAAETLRVATGVLDGALAALDPVLLLGAGLSAALRQLVTALEPAPGLVLRLRTDGWPDHLRTEADPVLYGAACELLLGVVQHGRDGVVDVELRVVDGTAVLQVHDDGSGAAAHLLVARPAGPPLGLAARRSRLEVAGGELHFRTSGDGCTVARATFPLPAGSS